MKKILYITYYWPPSGGAGVQRSLKFVKYLSGYGIEPLVLTVDPGRASYPITDESLLNEISPAIKIFTTNSFEPLKAFSKLSGKNKIPYGGFTNTQNEGFFQKIFRFIRGNFFIPDARRGWVKFAVKKAEAIMLAEKIDTVIISSPPHSSQLIGLKLKKIFPSCRWIADLRDPWTDIYYYKELNHTGPARKLDERYESEVLESCDAAIVVSKDIKRLFLKKSDRISEPKIHVIPNGFDLSDFKAGVEPEKDSFLITYVGTIADNYDPEILFKAFKNMIEAYSSIQLRIQFVGSISAQVGDLIRNFGLEDHVEMISHVSHREAIRYMQTSSMLLLLIPKVENDAGILTGKLFEYIGSGRPILGIGPPEGDAAMILNESKCGKMFGRNEAAALEKYLLDGLQQWQQDHRFGYTSPELSNYSRMKLSAQLADLLLE